MNSNRNAQDQKEELISRFVEFTTEVLKDRVTGIYLHGSAAMGCYNPEKSDLDLLVVLNDQITDDVKRVYMDRLFELDAQVPAKGIEMSIVTKDVCDPFVYPTPYILHYSRGHKEWYMTDPQDY
ncbi:MAG: nucleotidyltransferase domain-containing protein, partial [Clostridia bacterium]|nr:nucleotidyltransferase domain-containing protein [Clostridia bacterium]